jgi:hypothetical protein
LKIRRVLADQDKSNTDWQHDLIVSLQKLAATEATLPGGDNSQAAKTLLQEAANLATTYQGPDRQGMIDSINEASQALAK